MNILPKTHERIARFFESFIYGGRWVLAPMYVGLLATLFIYTWRFLVELFELCHHLSDFSEAEIMIRVLSLLDTVMVGNLLAMVMIGSYSIFVRRFKFSGEDKPQWLEHITSGTLKVKIGTSLVGISSIHLLKDFLDGSTVNQEIMVRHIAIHIVFLISTVTVAFTDKLLHPVQDRQPLENQHS